MEGIFYGNILQRENSFKNYLFTKLVYITFAPDKQQTIVNNFFSLAKFIIVASVGGRCC